MASAARENHLVQRPACEREDSSSVPAKLVMALLRVRRRSFAVIRSIAGARGFQRLSGRRKWARAAKIEKLQFTR